MVLSVGGSFACFARNARCTVTTDLLVWYSNTHNDFPPGAAIFSLHTLASPSGRNVNYDEKQLTGGGLSCSFCLYRFRKYVSCGFPVIDFCNRGVQYETPCILYYERVYWVLSTRFIWGGEHKKYYLLIRGRKQTWTLEGFNTLSKIFACFWHDIPPPPHSGPRPPHSGGF